jgi:hypothetical protein
VGNASEMDRFMVAFKDIMAQPVSISGRGGSGATR